ncbi:MAG: hypothetical protein IAF02_09105 [Anaerolineae bacterium]|nr:hypothetical protein [Anaerolineae bacterium]
MTNINQVTMPEFVWRSVIYLQKMLILYWIMGKGCTKQELFFTFWVDVIFPEGGGVDLSG